MEDRIINERESIELITKMIRNTQNRMDAGGGNIFLVWGYTVIAVTLLVYALFLAGFTAWCYWLWFLIPVVGITISKALKKGKEPGVVTYIDKVMGYIWVVVFMVAITVPVVQILVGNPSQILYIETLVLGMGVAISGLVIRFRAVTIGGIAGIILASGFLLPLGFSHQILLFGGLAIVILVIPGHILNQTLRKNKKEYANV